MKKNYILNLIIGLFVLINSSLLAQSVIIPAANTVATGTNNTEKRRPYGNFFGYERTALIYSPTEIGMTGNIDSIAFYLRRAIFPGSSPVKIYMKLRPTATFTTATTVSTEISGATLVYNATIPSTAFTDSTWVKVGLQTLFNYTGGSNNLEIIIESNSLNAGNESDTAKVFNCSSAANKMQYWYDDWSAPTTTGTRSSYRTNAWLHFGNGSGCTGAPTAGSIISAKSSVCVGDSTQLTLTGADVGLGIVYQWEKSTNGFTWTTMTGKTAAFINSSALNDSTYFRCKVKCSGQDSSYTNVIKVRLKSGVFCNYCVPSYSIYSCSNIDSLEVFENTNNTLTNVKFYDGGCSDNANYQYSQFDLTPNAGLQQGQTYTINITTQSLPQGGGVGGWIDFDGNNQFDTFEFIQFYKSNTNSKLYTGTINIPYTATAAKTVLRVRALVNSVSSGNACTDASGETHDYIINIITGSPCVDPPTAGTTSSTKNKVCRGESVNLSLLGNSIGLGMTFQWEYSYDNTVWSQVVGANNTPVLNGQSITDSVYYRCGLKCNGGGIVYSTSVKIGLNPPSECYCVTDLGGGCSSAALNSVVISGTTLSNTNVGCLQNAGENYSKFPDSDSTTADLAQGISYTLNTTYSATSSTGGVWIDYDQSGTFDANEYTLITTSSVAGNNSVSIVIPYTAIIGKTTMRVRSRGVSFASTDACETFYSGETQDYIINIIAGTPCVDPPTAGTINASPMSVCKGESTNLSLVGNTTGSGILFKWEFSFDNSNWAQVAGASNSPVLNGEVITTDSVYYRCSVQCNGGTTVYTTAIKIGTNSPLQCYCSSNLGGDCSSDAITAFSITGTTLNNTNAGCLQNAGANYSQFPDTGNTTGNLSQGVSYTFNINSSSSGMELGAWIDYDQSGTFDANEFTLVTSNSVIGANSASIAISDNALLGKTGLRIRSASDFFSSLTNADACNYFESGETQDYIINITPGTPCVDPPTPGTVTANKTMVCNGESVNLSLTGNSIGIGMAFQWEFSYDNISWAQVAGANPSATLNGETITTDSVYYRCGIQCGGGSIVYTTSVKIKLKVANQCYCASAATSTADDDIGNVSIATLNNGVATPALNNPTSVNLYTDYTNLPATSLVKGSSYPMTVTQINKSSFYSCYVKAYIDYDHDGTFADPAELILQGGTTSTNNVVAGNVSIPTTATLGETTMRVVLRESGSGSTTTACGSYSYGETEDYKVDITDITSIKSSVINETNVVIYPNPTNGLVNIALGTLKNATVQIQTVTGETVATTNAENTSQVVLNMASLAKGIYFVKIISEEKTISKKVVLQ